MHPVWSAVVLPVLRRLPLAALLVAVAAPPASAQSVTLNHDIDLVVDSGLVHVSQTDPRWASFPVGPDANKPIWECGCLLAALSTAIHQQSGGMLPWYPTVYFGGSGSAFDFNPRYLDVFLNVGVGNGFPPGWGYKRGLPLDTCGVVPLVQALQVVATDGFNHAVGFTPVVRNTAGGLGPDARNIVNRNLLAGRPTIIAVRRKNQPKADHAMLIAGWDNRQKAYKYLDPSWPRSGLHGPTRPQTIAGTLDSDDPNDPGYAPSFAKFEARIEAIIDVRRGGFAGTTPSFLFGDDPSPVEILMTGPDGRRTGFDPATAAGFDENDTASYWTLGPWSDPLGETRVGASPRFIAFPNAPSGTYHFTVTGTADGPLQLAAETMFGGTRALVGEFTGTIAMGEVRKYELSFARTGVSTVAEVTNFTPHAYPGDSFHARTDAPIAFDGRRSFDADGDIVSYDWDFGDGGTATGAQPEHIYAVPGTYTVTLTVTDADGATASGSLQAEVILSQRQPVARLTGPYLGFASVNPSWYVLLDARASSDPNGEALTYRWDFGDGTPPQVTTAPFVDHLYSTIGDYTVTLVVNDGIEDSAPATAAVTVVQAPGNRLTHSSAFLTPTCGAPGDSLTIVMGDFAQFQWWDFGTFGALPPFPPTTLMLGLSAPPGFIQAFVPVGSEATFLPFQATQLSPGRFEARASFTVPDLPPGRYQVRWAEDSSLPFDVGCPIPENRAPHAVAGGPYAGAVGAPIVFDGSRSSDLDGNELEYEWDFGDGEKAEGVSPTHTYAQEGRYIVTLTVSDGEGGNSAATMDSQSFAAATVTAGSLDTIPPVTSAVISPPAGDDGWHTTAVEVTLTAVDNPGGSGVSHVSYALSGAETDSATVEGDTAVFGVATDGITELIYSATDRAGNREAPQSRVIRIDRTPPAIAGMPGSGCSLWPPNHKMVTVAEVTATDGGSGLAPGGLVITATSSEPANGLGDGNTEPDVEIQGGTVAVRAERSGTAQGRTYTITATATDRAGNTSTQVSVCVVPHDQRGRR